jgi:NADPH:quinone reductase-like Zn-dependent oxidoreductase
MRATVIHAPGDIRVESLPEPKILAPTDAVIRTVAACVCGSDLWDYRGINEVAQPTPIGHEYVGVVEETGSEVRDIKPGQFVIGSFFASDNTCPVCHAGCQTSCAHKEFVGGCQAEYIRIPLAEAPWSPPGRRRRPGPPAVDIALDLVSGEGDFLGPVSPACVTADDLIEVQTLSVRIPARAALDLLEGDLGVRVPKLLSSVRLDIDMVEALVTPVRRG